MLFVFAVFAAALLLVHVARADSSATPDFVLADGTQCFCNQLVRASQFDGYYTNTRSSAPLLPGQCIQQPSVDAPNPLVACNEPIAFNVPDLRGNYSVQRPDGTGFEQVDIAQCGNLFYVVSPSRANVGPPTARTARTFRLGAGGADLTSDLLLFATTVCQPVVFRAFIAQPNRTLAWRAYAFDVGATQPSAQIESFTLVNFSAPLPSGGTMVREALLVRQVLPGLTDFNVPLFRVAPAPANQFVDARCFALCPDPTPPVPPALAAVSKVLTPCRNASFRLVPPPQVLEIDADCGFLGDSDDGFLSACSLARAPHVPNVAGAWTLPLLNVTLRIEQCADRIVIFFRESRHALDFRVTGRRFDGVQSVEPPEWTGGLVRHAAYEATVQNNAIVLTNAIDRIKRATFATYVETSIPGDNGRRLLHTFFDYAANSVQTVIGRPGYGSNV